MLVYCGPGLSIYLKQSGVSAMQERLMFKKLSKKGFIPRHVAEVGVYHPETSNIYEYIVQGVRCTLVEPDPKSIELIKRHFSALGNITLHEVAIYDSDGEIELVQRDASTFVSTLNSTPAIVNDDYEMNDDDKFVVESRTFDKIDDGSIDILSIDIEGGEWYVIKHMISRPMSISLETHGAIYVNPFMDEITEWMNRNNYRIWYKTLSDTVFVKRDGFQVGLADRFKLHTMNLYLSLRKQKKLLKKKWRARSGNTALH